MGRSVEGLQAVADEYRQDMPDTDERRDRAARTLGLDPAGLPSEATVLARLADFSQEPVAEARLVVGYEGDPLAPSSTLPPPALDRTATGARPGHQIAWAVPRLPGPPGRQVRPGTT
ncbi:hypothetical protein [Streptomyces sp. NPDC057238]|uniref:hypothetical protein n=1 Tax=Streptomyces sp. NPDC057238 TaxID=3346060 RepID=UPI003629226C